MSPSKQIMMTAAGVAAFFVIRSFLPASVKVYLT